MSTAILTASGGAWPPAPPAPSTLPYDATVTCVAPTYDGSGKLTHPSVVDMGRRWNGYRWWLADTPYPNRDDDYENPSIWGSNDRINWEVPPGLTNPIDPWPGGEKFNSDTELVWDPDGQRLIVYWREADMADTTWIDYYAASSTDGHTWTHQPEKLLSIYTGLARMSPSLARIAADDWRMWTIDNDSPCAMFTATGPFGPWTSAGELIRNGADFVGWHGDFIHHGGVFYAIVGDTGSGTFRPSVSLDGLTWYGGDPVFGAGYRATMLPPVNGEVEVWYSRANALRYTRIPAAYWTDLIP